MSTRFLYLRQALLMFVFSLLAFSCSDEMHMLFPEGPQGPAGLSAYEVWVKAVNDGEVDWPKDRTDISNFFLFLKGKDGNDGVNGLDGKSAYDLWKEQVEKGLENPHEPGTDWPKDQTYMNDFWHYLQGAKGQDGLTPKIGDNGNWFVGGEDTGIPARGKDGNDGKDGKDALWTIGDNGNWWYWDYKEERWIDSYKPSTGERGEAGKDGLQYKIGDNGNWFVYNYDTKEWEDTGKPSQGAKGDKGDKGNDGSNGNSGTSGTNGANGLSAYQLWYNELHSKGLLDPHDPSKHWDVTDDSEEAFWRYLRGNDGKDGAPGKDGKDASGIIQPNPVGPNFSVLAEYYGDSKYREYVIWEDGSVKYGVYTGKSITERVGAGVKVKNMPKVLDPNKEYETDEQGYFWVPKEDLSPDVNNGNDIYGKPEVTLTDGSHPNMATATYVPCRMRVKLEYLNTKLGDGKGTMNIPTTDIYFKVWRKVDFGSDWESLPSWYANKGGKVLWSRFDSKGTKLTKDYMQDVNNAHPYKLSDCDSWQSNVLPDRWGIWLQRRVKDTDYYTFTKEDRFLQKQDCTDHWYGKEGERYFIGDFKLTKQRTTDPGICYGEEPTNDTYVEEMPMIPFPCFNLIVAEYANDNTNIHAAFHCDKELMASFETFYTNNYSKTPVNIENGSISAYVPAFLEVSVARDQMNLRISTSTTTSSGETVTRSKYHKMSELLENNGNLYLEDIKSGSLVQFELSGKLAWTFYAYNVGTIYTPEAGHGESFTFTISNPAINHPITIIPKER